MSEYRFTTSADARAIDHSEHAWEEWHAYLSADYPDWVTGNGYGMCCHTCQLVIVESFAPYATTAPEPEDETIPAGSQVSVTIGRNVPTTSPLRLHTMADGPGAEGAPSQVPMSRKAWHEFREDVLTILVDILAPVDGLQWQYDGTGEWEGVPEESTITVVISGADGSRDRLESALANLSKMYDQDAVALAIGTSTLVARKA